MIDTSPFHPAANLFPMIEGKELDILAADIKKNGLLEPIVVYEGKILDGRCRSLACEKAKRLARTKPFEGKDPIAYVISMNLHRRHLTSKQKRAIITKLLKEDPSKSDLQIAKAVKASPHTVSKARARMEEAGDVCTVQTRTDTKGRKQPAKKKTRKPRKNKPRACDY